MADHGQSERPPRTPTWVVVLGVVAVVLVLAVLVVVLTTTGHGPGRHGP